MDSKEKLIQALTQIVTDLGFPEVGEITLDHPDAQFGDYTTNIAMVLAKTNKQNPRALAEQIQAKLAEKRLPEIKESSVAGPGFINITLTDNYFVTKLLSLISSKKKVDLSSKIKNKKIMVEYAHPNTHKEMHIGHMRTLITGEAVSRLLEAAGAQVFRANYQGDIGPHIARALYGIQKLMQERGLVLKDVDAWSNKEKTHFLGEGYVRGNQDYEQEKTVIDTINKELYGREKRLWELYQQTRKWNLDYYEEFYKRFYTKFDRLFFESEMDDKGVSIVKEFVGKIFREENGAIIFPGEEYGLHTRVFITQAGYPTYEGKEMANAFAEYEAFPFDVKMHVVASEQTGYFQVVIKALELIDPEKFKGTQYHLPMGMVHLKDRKMSSRTGDVLTVDWLLDQVQAKVEELMADGRIDEKDKAKTIEQIVIGAVKYSVLKVNTLQDASFDIETSVSLDGDSGPYLQYSYVRTQSILAKAGEVRSAMPAGTMEYTSEERALMRLLARFDATVIDAAEKYSPNILCNYLFNLAQAFNLFYQKMPILKAEGDTKIFRLALTGATGKVIKEGLDLLGIQAPEKM